MKAKSIEGRYSIEYVFSEPNTHKKTKKRWGILISAIGGILLSLGLVFSIIFPKNLDLIKSFSATDFFKSKQIELDLSTDATTTDEDEYVEEIIEEKEGTVEIINEPLPETETLVVESPPLEKKEEQSIPTPQITSNKEQDKQTPSHPAINENKKESQVLVHNSEKENNPRLGQTEEAVKRIEILLQKNKEQLDAANKQKTENEALTKKIDDLGSKLVQEQKKIEALNVQIDLHKGKNNKLSGLLDQALSNANTVDKNYISSLNELELEKEKPQDAHAPTKIVESEDTLIISNEDDVKTENKIAKSTPIEPESKNIDYNNSISSTTTTQVDAIVLAMQGIIKKNIVTTEQENKKEENSETQKSETIQKQSPDNNVVKTELLHLKLQRQINNLVSSDAIEDTNYKTALNSESEVRSNEVRSITVKDGDTLWEIAKRAYGNGSFYKKIIEANPQIEKNGKIHLREGQVIRVPI